MKQRKRKPKLRWRLTVFNGRSADLMLHRLGLGPSADNPGDYVRFYADKAKPVMLDHIKRLKAVGLHGLGKRVAVKKPPSLDAKPPRPKKPKPPDAIIIRLTADKAARVEREVARISDERQRQSERLAEADARERARLALLRAKGEV